MKATTKTEELKRTEYIFFKEKKKLFHARSLKAVVRRLL